MSPKILAVPFLLIFLAMPILGAIAISQIRASGGKLRGLGLAVFDLLLVPLLALDGLIFAVCSILLNGNSSFQNSAPVAVMTLILSIPIDALIAAWAWRRLSRMPGAPVGPPMPGSSHVGYLALGLALLAFLGTPLLLALVNPASQDYIAVFAIISVLLAILTGLFSRTRLGWGVALSCTVIVGSLMIFFVVRNRQFNERAQTEMANWRAQAFSSEKAHRHVLLRKDADALFLQAKMEVEFISNHTQFSANDLTRANDTLAALDKVSKELQEDTDPESTSRVALMKETRALILKAMMEKGMAPAGSAPAQESTQPNPDSTVEFAGAAWAEDVDNHPNDYQKYIFGSQLKNPGLHQPVLFPPMNAQELKYAKGHKVGPGISLGENNEEENIRVKALGFDQPPRWLYIWFYDRQFKASGSYEVSLTDDFGAQLTSPDDNANGSSSGVAGNSEHTSKEGGWLLTRIYVGRNGKIPSSIRVHLSRTPGFKIAAQTDTLVFPLALHDGNMKDDSQDWHAWHSDGTPVRDADELKLMRDTALKSDADDSKPAPGGESAADPGSKPELCFLTWRNADTKDNPQDWRAWHSDGTPVKDPDELKLMRDKQSHLLTMFRPEALKKNYLWVWIHLPDLGKESRIKEITMTGTDGKRLPMDQWGNYYTWNEGWLVGAFRADVSGSAPPTANFQVKYISDSWNTLIDNIRPKPSQAPKLEGDIMPGSAGQTADEHAFISFVLSENGKGSMDYDFLAVTKDHQELKPRESGGGSNDNMGTLTAEFDVKLDQVDHFVLLGRPIKTVEFKNVPLSPSAENAQTTQATGNTAALENLKATYKALQERVTQMINSGLSPAHPDVMKLLQQNEGVLLQINELTANPQESAELAKAKADLWIAKRTYGPGHPEVLALQKRVDELLSQQPAPSGPTPPQLRFLAWMDESTKNEPQGWLAWHRDGSVVQDETEQRWMERLQHEDPLQSHPDLHEHGYLCLWITGPQIENGSSARIAVYDPAGSEIPFENTKIAMAASGPEGCITFVGVAKLQPALPSWVNITCLYAGGPWKDGIEIPAETKEKVALDKQASIDQVGEFPNGHAFVRWRNVYKAPSMQYYFVAITKDGRAVERNGSNGTYMTEPDEHIETNEFPLKLSEIKAFRAMTRPVRTVQYANVPLRPDHVHNAYSSQPQESPAETSVINIAADGSVILDNTLVSMDELRARLKDLVAKNPKQAVVLRGDVKTNYKYITTVLDICKDAGISQSGFAASAQKTPEGGKSTGNQATGPAETPATSAETVRPRTYSTSAFLEIKSPASDPHFAENHISIIQSRPILESVIDEMGLINKWSAGLSKKLSKDEAYQKLSKMIAARQQPNTDLVELAVTSTDSKEAADIANTVATTFQKQSVIDQKKLAESSLAEFTAEIEKQKKVVDQAAAKAAKIRTRDKIDDPHPDNTETPVTPRNPDYESAKGDYIAEKTVLEMAQHRMETEKMQMKIALVPVKIWEMAAPESPLVHAPENLPPGVRIVGESTVPPKPLPDGNVYVYGEVKNTGMQSIPAGGKLTASQAVLAAGGATPEAALRKAKVFRKMPDGGSRTYELDLKEVIEFGKFDHDMDLQQGDYVYLPKVLIEIQ